MKQQTFSEKDAYLHAREYEHEVTLRVLRAYPPDQAGFKPHERSKTAIDLASLFFMQHGLVDDILASGLQMKTPPAPPKTWPELISIYEKAHGETMRKIRAMPEEAMNGTIQMPVGKGKMGEMRRGEVLWFFLNDMIHHRGQLSVYLRMVGGKVPSIYGPSADEPWN